MLPEAILAFECAIVDADSHAEIASGLCFLCGLWQSGFLRFAQLVSTVVVFVSTNLNDHHVSVKFCGHICGDDSLLVAAKTSGLSTSPAATVLQLNYPLSGVSSSLLGGMTSSVTSAEGSTAAAQGVNAAAPSPVIGARAVTPTNPAVLKLGSTASQNDIMPK